VTNSRPWRTRYAILGGPGQWQNHEPGCGTHAARVVAFPISRYTCLSIIANDSGSPLVYKFWPNIVFSSQLHRKMEASTLKGRVGFAVIGPQVGKGTRQDGHGVRVVTTCVYQFSNGSLGRVNRPEGTEEPVSVSMHNSVLGNFKPELVVLLLGRQDTIDEKISSFQMVGLESQLLDRIPSGLMTSVHVDMSALRSSSTYNGELGCSC